MDEEMVITCGWVLGVHLAGQAKRNFHPGLNRGCLQEGGTEEE
jgi:hypothetical protein